MGHLPTPAADTSQQWRGADPRTLSQGWRGTTHHHEQQTPARNGGNLHRVPSARIREGPPKNHHLQTQARNGGELHPGPSARRREESATTISSGAQPGMAGNCTQGPQPGLARDHPQTPAAVPSQEFGGELFPEPSARLRPGPPTTTSSRRKPGIAGDCTRHAKPGLVREHQQPPPADSSQKQRGTAPSSLSKDSPATSDHHQQRTPARNGGESHPGPSARIERNHQPTRVAGPSQEWRRTAPRTLSQDW